MSSGNESLEKMSFLLIIANMWKHLLFIKLRCDKIATPYPQKNVEKYRFLDITYFLPETIL